MTRLSLICDRIIEACWLAALVVTPLFFNPYSSRVFEPDKTAILRSLVLIIGLAWIVRTVERRGLDPRPRMIPLVGGAVLVLLVAVEATLLSIAPRISLWGSYVRLQGLYTSAAHIGIFLSIAGLLRTREQMDRLITTALLASLPVSLYGIIQYFGTDPLRWAEDVTVRVASTMGNPIFVAAYLILAVPLALLRLIQSGGSAVRSESPVTKWILVVGALTSLGFQMVAWLSGPIAGTASALITVMTWTAVSLLLRRPVNPFLRISIYTVLLSAQLMCILFSQSRGPWLGLAGGLFVSALLWTIVRGRRRQAFAVIGTGLAIAVSVAAANWPGSEATFIRDIPYIGRAARLTSVEGGSGRVRVLIWEGVSELIAHNPGRSMTGYGPETLALVYPPYYRPELGRIHDPDALADRAHNQVFDVVVTTGFVGLAAYLLFITGLLYYGLGWLGLLQSRRLRHVFLWVWFGSGLSAVAFALLFDGGWRFAGIALPVGLFAGLVLFLCGRGFQIPAGRSDKSDRERSALRLVIVAALGVVITHFLETQVGLAIAATQTYFWTFAGVIVACGAFGRSTHPDHHAPPPQPHSPTASILISAVIPLTLVYAFIVPSAAASGSVWWLLAFTWLFGGIVTTAEAGLPAGKATVHYCALSLAPTAVFAMFLQGLEEQNLIFGYTAVLISVVLLAGLSPGMTRQSDLQTIRSRRLSLAYVALAAAALLAVNETNLSVIRADIHFLTATRHLERDRRALAVDEIETALSLKPEVDRYHAFLGQALFEQAWAAGGKDSLMVEAERALRTAREISPLDAGHSASLGRLFQTWAKQTRHEATRVERFEKSLAAFEMATILSPMMPHLWNDRGSAYLAAGDTARAEDSYRHSLALDGQFHQTLRSIGDLRYSQGRWLEAIAMYEKVLELEPQIVAVQLRLAVAKSQLRRASGVQEGRSSSDPIPGAR